MGCIGCYAEIWPVGRNPIYPERDGLTALLRMGSGVALPAGTSAVSRPASRHLTTFEVGWNVSTTRAPRLPP